MGKTLLAGNGVFQPRIMKICKTKNVVQEIKIEKACNDWLIFHRGRS